MATLRWWLQEDDDRLALRPFLNPTSPLLPTEPGHLRILDSARQELTDAVVDTIHDRPDSIEFATAWVMHRLRAYVTHQFEPPKAERLYALEFVGPRTQYVKIGRSSDIRRRTDRLEQEARLHGFGLVDGWASPRILAEPKSIEQSTLDLAEALHGKAGLHERFYGMAFPDAVWIARGLYEESIGERRREVHRHGLLARFTVNGVAPSFPRPDRAI